jgi:hypothetical protein
MKRTLVTAAVTILATCVLAGCATVPTGPAVMVLPGSRKTLEQFNADDASCRQFAQARLGPDPAYPANNAQAAATLGSAALGAAAGAIIGAATGQAGAGAAIGAGSGLLWGGAASSAYGYDATIAMQMAYDRAYAQCMFARGNQVPGLVARNGGYRPAPAYPGYAPPAGAVPYGSNAPAYGPPPSAGGVPPPNSAPPPGGYPPPNTPPPVR